MARGLVDGKSIPTRENSIAVWGQMGGMMPGTLRNCSWSVRLQGQVRRGMSGSEAKKVDRVKAILRSSWATKSGSFPTYNPGA